jgi:hypothetical protein
LGKNISSYIFPSFSSFFGDSNCMYDRSHWCLFSKFFSFSSVFWTACYVFIFRLVCLFFCSVYMVPGRVEGETVHKYRDGHSQGLWKPTGPVWLHHVEGKVCRLTCSMKPSQETEWEYSSPQRVKCSSLLYHTGCSHLPISQSTLPLQSNYNYLLVHTMVQLAAHQFVCATELLSLTVLNDGEIWATWGENRKCSPPSLLCQCPWDLNEINNRLKNWVLIISIHVF